MDTILILLEKFSLVVPSLLLGITRIPLLAVGHEQYALVIARGIQPYGCHISQDLFIQLVAYDSHHVYSLCTIIVYLESYDLSCLSYIIDIHTMMFGSSTCQAFVSNFTLGAVGDNPYTYETKAEAIQEDSPTIRDWRADDVI